MTCDCCWDNSRSNFLHLRTDSCGAACGFKRLNDLTLLFVLTGKVNKRHTWAGVANTQRSVGDFQK